ncbi:carbohydrate ABC transporter permease [Chelativorans salis]|uniref:Sugar ABC transporter permease n=1 Tax=Chelativorans salis TaxID=2978478 RepID=A0ABT2LVP6_9HYPH|nr:sugar ABC transporter permease [Chelativorans sp. EGI FJ00035]MCT7377653.1 sugar ABC transporter permease [Chelativorans sp. EGI FJ00035]
MTAEARHETAGERLAGLLLAPVRWGMNLIDRPMTWLQRRLGLGGVAAAFLAPNLLVFGIFVLFPMMLNVAYSFTGGGALFLNNRVFVGTLQYETLLSCRDFLDASSCREDRFWRAVGNTGFFVIVQVAALVLISLATALVLNREMRARGFWRAVFFFPVLLSPVVVALIWKWILQRNGLLNAVLVELSFEPTLWLVNRGWAMFWAIFLSIWAHLGFYTLILLAGLQAIPRELYEAAEMDGAPSWRVLTRITLPLLWPNLVVVILLALIRAVQVFDEVFVLTGGGPGTATLFLVQYIYETGLAQQVRNLGLASAASILMAAVLIVLTLVQLLASAWRERKEQR